MRVSGFRLVAPPSRALRLVAEPPGTYALAVYAVERTDGKPAGKFWGPINGRWTELREVWVGLN